MKQEDNLTKKDYKILIISFILSLIGSIILIFPTWNITNYLSNDDLEKNKNFQKETISTLDKILENSEEIKLTLEQKSNNINKKIGKIREISFKEMINGKTIISPEIVYIYQLEEQGKLKENEINLILYNLKPFLEAGDYIFKMAIKSKNANDFFKEKELMKKYWKDFVNTYINLKIILNKNNYKLLDITLKMLFIVGSLMNKWEMDTKVEYKPNYFLKILKSNYYSEYIKVIFDLYSITK